MSQAPEQSIEEFKDQYGSELDELIDFGIYEDEPLPPDPSSMGIGETDLEDLSDEQIVGVRDVLFARLAISEEDPEALKEDMFQLHPKQQLFLGK